MLSSLKKWVQDVAVDLAPPPSTSSSSSFVSSSSIPGSTHHYFYSTTPVNEQQESRKSSLSAVYLSRPISLDSVKSSRTTTISIPPPIVSPVELDLSHLNREEQEHIANVLRRARAVEDQQQSHLPSVSVPSRLSPSASISSPISSSSSSTSTSSFASEQLEKYDNEISDKVEKFITLPESTLKSIHQCQICGREHEENSTICFQCQEHKLIDREIENNKTLLSQQLIPINNSLSPLLNRNESYEEDEIYDNIMTNDQKKEIITDINHNYTKKQDLEIIPINNRTEIDENEFFYEEPSPYILANKPIKEEDNILSYQIDELNDDDDNDERDHVKELEETIANLSRHFPSETIQTDSKSSSSSSSILPINNIDTDSILEMEIESPPTDELSFNPPTHPLTLSISVPIPINNHRGSISRSSGIRENLTDLLILATRKSHQPLQRTLSTHSKHMSSTNRHKRNLPSVPSNGNSPTPSNRLQLRRANSESRFSLPAVPSLSQQNLDDEADLLEIDLNDPIGSMNRTLQTKIEPENNQSKVKQIRDQTTNTPPISTLNSSIKSKKKLKKKNSPPLNPPTNEQITSPVIPSITKLQKSTSTEITYPFPVAKLILNPSRHGISTDLGFRITGGHSNTNCMEVTACIENIDIYHRNYQILKNIVQEGDEVLELGGVSLRGKSALFVQNLMNTIQNEFEIIVRNQFIHDNSHSFLTPDTNIQRRHSMVTSPTQPTNTPVIKSKSTSIYSLHQKSTNTTEDKPSTTKTSISNDLFSHRPRSSLLPNDPGLNGAGIDLQSSNESDESDSLSQCFNSLQSRTSSIVTSNDNIKPHGRSQSVIPIANYTVNASNRLQNFLRSDSKRPSRGSTSIERKSSLSFASLKFLKKKTKSVDFSHQKNLIINQLRENDYVGDIELQIGHDGEREQLVVRIIRAKNLLPKDTNGFSDPFVKIYLLPGRDQENKRRIKHLSKTLNPVWDQTVIYGHMHREEVQYKKLEITVWDYDRFKANDFLGQVTIDLKDPNTINDKPHWYRLQSLRSREETSNRGSSPRLFKMTSVDSSPASSTTTINKNSVNIQPRINQQK